MCIGYRDGVGLWCVGVWWVCVGVGMCVWECGCGECVVGVHRCGYVCVGVGMGVCGGCGRCGCVCVGVWCVCVCVGRGVVWRMVNKRDRRKGSKPSLPL